MRANIRSLRLLGAGLTLHILPGNPLRATPTRHIDRHLLTLRQAYFPTPIIAALTVSCSQSEPARVKTQVNAVARVELTGPCGLTGTVEVLRWSFPDLVAN